MIKGRVQISDVLENLEYREWLLIGDPVDEVSFNEGFTNLGNEIVSWANLIAERDRLQAEYDANQYQRDRAVAYPSLQDQADMAYWDRKNGTTTLDDAIDAVKAAHPKPE